MGQPEFSHNAFRNWWAFQAELKGRLVAAKLEAEGVNRVMARTQKAYSSLRFATIAATMRPENAEQIRRYELQSQDFKELQMHLLSSLIDSYILVERSQQRTERGLQRLGRRIA